MKRRRGLIELDSEPSTGTEFRILLPVSPQDVKRRPASCARQLLLVVDEGSGPRHARGLWLSGHRLRTCGRGSRAPPTRHAEIGAVLVNMSMPDVDSAELLRQLAKQNRRVRVITTSGLTETSSVDGVQGIIRATLPKPYTSERLLDVVSQVLEMA